MTDILGTGMSFLHDMSSKCFNFDPVMHFYMKQSDTVNVEGEGGTQKIVKVNIKSPLLIYYLIIYIT